MNEKASKIIDSNGGTTAVAKVCGLRPQAVSRWRKFGIPRAWMKFIESGGLMREQLHDERLGRRNWMGNIDSRNGSGNSGKHVNK